MPKAKPTKSLKPTPPFDIEITTATQLDLARQRRQVVEVAKRLARVRYGVNALGNLTPVMKDLRSALKKLQRVEQTIQKEWDAYAARYSSSSKPAPKRLRSAKRAARS